MLILMLMLMLKILFMAKQLTSWVGGWVYLPFFFFFFYLKAKYNFHCWPLPSSSWSCILLKIIIFDNIMIYDQLSKTVASTDTKKIRHNVANKARKADIQTDRQLSRADRLGQTRIWTDECMGAEISSMWTAQLKIVISTDTIWQARQERQTFGQTDGWGEQTDI